VPPGGGDHVGVCRRCGARLGTERFCRTCGTPAAPPPHPGAAPYASRPGDGTTAAVLAPPERVAPERPGRRSPVFLVLGAVLLLVLGAGAGFGLGRVTGGPTPLVAPQLLGPSDGSAFTHYPRDLDLRWSPVAGAASYTVEVQFLNGSSSPVPDWRLEPADGITAGVTSTSVRHTFGGSQPGRWRITAVGPDGTTGAASAWWGFTFEL
jgi:hypothetical protein